MDNKQSTDNQNTDKTVLLVSGIEWADERDGQATDAIIVIPDHIWTDYGKALFEENWDKVYEYYAYFFSAISEFYDNIPIDTEGIEEADLQTVTETSPEAIIVLSDDPVNDPSITIVPYTGPADAAIYF